MCTNQYYKWHGTHVIFPFSHIDKEKNNNKEVQNNPSLSSAFAGRFFLQTELK
jgi:hypothetical protein